MHDDAARPPRLPPVLLLASLLTACGVATAGTEESPAPITYFETATVRARPLATATGSVTVLEREEIEALNVSSVAELIRFLPGVDVVWPGPRGATAFAQIRGGDPNFTVVLLDGVPLNDGTDRLGGAVDLNALSVEHVERIEVVRGPASSSYGSAALGGVINVITRRDETAPEMDFSVTGGAGAGDSDTGDASILEAALSLAGGDEERGWFFGASVAEEDDVVQDDEFSLQAVTGNWRTSFADDAALSLDGRIATRESSDFPEGSGGAQGTAGLTRDSDHDEQSLGVEVLLGRDGRPHKLYATGYRHALDRASPRILGPDPSGGDDDIPAAVEETAYIDLRAGWAYTVLETQRTGLSLGVEFRREEGDNDGEFFFEFGPGVIVPVDFSYDLERTTRAAFVEYLSQPGRFQIELGGRFDAPGTFDSEFSPRLGVAYLLPGDRTRLRLAGGRAFKLPSFFALGSPATLGGNPDLEPEIAVSFEAGLEHGFGHGRPSFSLVAFRTEYEDLIDFLLPPEGFGLVNRSEVRSVGGTLSASWLPTEAFTLRANVTYQDVEDTDTGATLKNRPEWFGGLRVGWQALPRLALAADLQAADESFDEQLPFGRTVVPGYGLAGLAVDADLTRGWQLEARVDNLVDREYERLAGFPGPERIVRVGLTRGTR
jgi:iron complex outermembrane receptor protein/vitamin B12 transporter